ncbi:MAG: TonB-dependent receptor, partial [Cyclobacteriaceae bacterium]|nr:TonB-dependent receptor [Cyclobacteriaceae bacterium]
MRNFIFKFFLSFVFLLGYVQLQAQSVSGKVTDASSGEGLPGVNILIKGTTSGTISDTDGNYNLQAASNATLVFSFVGYEAQEVSVNGRQNISIAMSADLQQLSEVVVVGYGTQRKVDLTGAVGSISAEKIATRPINSPDQALAGQVAGVSIINRAGDPAAPINVRIRGVGTVGNNQPLWVIDGVPIVQTTNITVNTSSTTDSNPLAGINPSDIESIDVLKDASAAAIYGSRAANGVIIVTTKRGESGRIRASYDGYVGTAEVRESLSVLNKDQYIDIQGELGRDLSSFRGLPEVDWQDQVFQSAPMQSHNITVSGGTDNVNFFISGGYQSNEGIERGQDFERYSVKVNGDVKAGERFRFGESILISRTNRLTQSEGVGDCCAAAFNASQNAPYFQVFDPNGPFGYNQENPTTVGDGFGQNYVFRTDPRVNKTTIENTKVLGNIYGEFKIIEGLTFRMSGGIDYNVGNANILQSEVSFTGLDVRQSLGINSRPVELTTNWTNTLTYTKEFGDHNLTVLLGYEETNFEFDKVRIQGRNLFNTNFPATGTAVAAANEGDLWSLKGILGRVNYSYMNKYLATVNVRRDATSRFAEDNRDDIFPSFSAGWRLSEENFFPATNWIDDVKIRAGWGQSGNQFTGVNFAFLSALQSTIFYIVGDGQVVSRGPAPVNFANEALKWETSTQFDIGFDASFLEGKLDVTFDYYNKKSEDVLIGLPLPFVSGYFLPADANVGEIRNTGIELTASYRNSAGDFTYGISGNITTVNNEVLDLGEVTSINTGIGGGQTHRTVVGESVGHFYGYRTNGIYQTQEEVNAAVPDVFSGGLEPGDIRFVDVNGDGVVDAGDRTILGSPIPGFFYGIQLDAAYKGFDLAIFFQGVGDRQVYNQGRSENESLAGNQNFSSTVLNRWTGAGTSNSIPRLTESDPNGNQRYSDRWIEDADYMRIKNLQLGYTLPVDLVQKLNFISSIRAYIGIQNLATFTD